MGGEFLALWTILLRLSASFSQHVHSSSSPIVDQILFFKNTVALKVRRYGYTGIYVDLSFRVTGRISYLPGEMELRINSKRPKGDRGPVYTGGVYRLLEDSFYDCGDDTYAFEVRPWEIIEKKDKLVSRLGLVVHPMSR